MDEQSWKLLLLGWQVDEKLAHDELKGILVYIVFVFESIIDFLHLCEVWKLFNCQIYLLFFINKIYPKNTSTK
jgi:hypothetical protein